MLCISQILRLAVFLIALPSVGAECGKFFISIGSVPHFAADSLPPDPYDGDLTSSSQTLKQVGFKGNWAKGFVHPEYAVPVQLTSQVSVAQKHHEKQVSGGFTYEQRIPGRTKILDPQWMAAHDVETILGNLDAILNEDIYPVIHVQANLSPNGIRESAKHEMVHYLDSLLPEGRRRLAIMLAGANTDPQYVCEALAYDTFTEMRAYAVNGHPGLRPAVEQLDSMVRANPNDAQGVVMANAPNCARRSKPARISESLRPPFRS